jgi:hypothetical protein
MLMSEIKGLKVEYSDKPDDYYCSLADYILMSRKSIMKFANRLAPMLLKNEDFVSHVAHSIMMADWRWNGEGDRVGYRAKCASWAIKVGLRKLRSDNIRNTGFVSLNLHSCDDGELSNVIEDKRQRTNYGMTADDIIENATLTSTQKKYFKFHRIR